MPNGSNPVPHCILLQSGGILTQTISSQSIHIQTNVSDMLNTEYIVYL